MQDLSSIIHDVLNKITLIKCSNNYLHDNVTRLSKDDFVDVSFASQTEILEIEKKLKTILILSNHI